MVDLSQSVYTDQVQQLNFNLNYQLKCWSILQQYYSNILHGTV